MLCPHCFHPIDRSIIAQDIGQHGGRPQVHKPCPKGCGQILNATQMRKHIPNCHPEREQ